MAVHGRTSDELPCCMKHHGEEMSLYCRAHGTLGCGVCMMLSHTHCEKDYIPEVSESYLNHLEYKNFEKSLDDLKGNCAEQIRATEADIVHVNETCEGIISSVKERKKELISSLDKFEKEFDDSLAEYRKENIDKLDTLKQDYKKVETEIIQTKSTLSLLKKDKNYNSLYYEVKKETGRMTVHRKNTYELATRYRTPLMLFNLNKRFVHFCTKEKLFGSLEVKKHKLGSCNAPEMVNKNDVYQINIKFKNDRKVCFATGLAFLSTDQLAVADKSNKNVKIVDVTYDKIISEIGLSSSPRDITAIPPNQLAVTLRDEYKIQLLSTASGLEKSGEINTDEKCRGITYNENMLYVTFDNSFAKRQVQILNLQGEVLKRMFQPGFLSGPKCIGLSPSGKNVYVTDYVNRQLYCIDETKEVKTLACNKKLMGMTVSNSGTVYTSAVDENAVFQCSDDISQIEEVLSERDGITGPIALAISKTTSLLYVSCGGGDAEKCNALQVFKVI